MSKTISKSIRPILIFIFFIVLPFSLLYLLTRESRFTHHLEDLIQNAGAAGPLVSVLFFCVLAFTPIPTESVAILNGLLFGPVYGSLISLVGNTLAAVLEYIVGRRLRHATQFKATIQPLPFGLHALAPSSFLFLFIGRFVPNVGGKIVSVTAGLYKVPFKRYILITTLVNIIGSVVYAVGGYAIFHY